MARAYSLDLRERVVGAVAVGQPCRAVASTFGVSVASVVKWSQRFRATGNAAQSSHQLDVVVFDSSKPVLFRDGDLVFVTPDAVYGVIEVKSRATPGIVADAAQKLAEDMVLIRQGSNSGAFAGLFAFEDDGGESAAYLSSVAEAAEQWENRLDFVCSGRRRFIRYWHFEPQNERRLYEGWHSYALPETAPGYFFHNVIDCVSPESVFSNKDVWYPRDGKEQYVDGEIPGRWPRQRSA